MIHQISTKNLKGKKTWRKKRNKLNIRTLDIWNLEERDENMKKIVNRLKYWNSAKLKIYFLSNFEKRKGKEILVWILRIFWDIGIKIKHFLLRYASCYRKVWSTSLKMFPKFKPFSYQIKKILIALNTIHNDIQLVKSRHEETLKYKKIITKKNIWFSWIYPEFISIARRVSSPRLWLPQWKNLKIWII